LDQPGEASEVESPKESRTAIKNDPSKPSIEPVSLDIKKASEKPESDGWGSAIDLPKTVKENA
jgi:hypothetical protein